MRNPELEILATIEDEGGRPAGFLYKCPQGRRCLVQLGRSWQVVMLRTNQNMQPENKSFTMDGQVCYIGDLSDAQIISLVTHYIVSLSQRKLRLVHSQVAEEALAT